MWKSLGRRKHLPRVLKLDGTPARGAGRRAVKELGEGEAELAEYADASSERHQGMVERIRQRLGLTTLQYQQLPDLVEAIGLPKERLCTYCWDGAE